MKKIALLGVTGYIGQSLLAEFCKEQGGAQLFLFSRSKRTMQSLTKQYSKKGGYSLHTLDEFLLFEYDVVINCTGIGDPKLLKKNPSEIFRVTEEMDSMVITYLTKKPKAQYINMSSGAVYGDNFKKPITEGTSSVLNINTLSLYENYAIAKINSEAKHRSLSHLNIVDLRVFAFFSSFADGYYCLPLMFSASGDPRRPLREGAAFDSLDQLEKHLDALETYLPQLVDHAQTIVGLDLVLNGPQQLGSDWQLLQTHARKRSFFSLVIASLACNPRFGSVAQDYKDIINSPADLWSSHPALFTIKNVDQLTDYLSLSGGDRKSENA